MRSEKYGEDLKQIRSIMDRSTRFISLSGLSGVLAGFYALAGSFAAHLIIKQHNATNYREDYLDPSYSSQLLQDPSLKLLTIAAIVLLLAVATAFFLTRRKAQKTNQQLWGSQTWRLINSFMAPLIIGGLFTLVLLQYHLIALVAPSMLIFYGIACMSASKFTLGTVKYLGITCAILGLVNTQFVGYGVYFWAAGFGVSHIVYGLIMYNKYDRIK